MTDAIQSSLPLTNPVRQEPVRVASSAREVAPGTRPTEPTKTQLSVAEDRSLFDAADLPKAHASAPLAGPSALTTYRDQDSGRVIVRLFDKDSGHVLAEFPPEKTYRPIAASNFEDTPRPKTRVDV